MKTTVPYNFKKAILFGALVALPFAFAGCEKENTTPNNNGGNGGTNPGGGTQPQKHNVELVYGKNEETAWNNISMDTLYKYNEDRTVDSIFMIPEMTNQFSTYSTNQLKYIIPLLRQRHNVNPKKIFGKGELQLKNESIMNNPEIIRFFADTLKYNVTSR